MIRVYKQNNYNDRPTEHHFRDTLSGGFFYLFPHYTS